MRRLTEAAQAERDAFERLNSTYGCSCHSMPPCSVCTHPGNPLNQEDDSNWEYAYTKDEALWYAICQLRRAARTFEVLEVGARSEYLVDIYAKGLDMCADECEKAIDPEELKKLTAETFPNDEVVNG